MPGSRENESAPERDLQDTRDDLAQASIALNTAYDRLQGLRASLRSFTAQRDRLSGFRRPHHQSRLQSDDLMRPEHSAIVLSDSEDESEIDIEALRESIPSRLLELTSRWGNQHARLTAAARQVTAADTRNSSSSLYSPAVSSDEARLVFPPPPRRRRAPPSATPSSRDGAVLPPPNVVSPVRIGMLEAHVRELRRLRLASIPGDSSTTLGRRVAQRQAAANERSEYQMHGPGTGATSESIVRSTIPLGLEPRPTPPPRSYGSTNLLIEPRAATHLRHSLLPTPPAGIRLGTSNRVSSSNGAHARFNDRLERTRAARSNSVTAVSRGPSPTPTLVQDNRALEVSTQPPVSPRTRTTNAWEETPLRSVFLDSNPNYPARRRVRTQGQEEPRDINWRELMLQGSGDDILDAPTWLRPHLRQILRVGSRSSRVQPEVDTDRANQSPRPASSNDINATGQEGRSIQRRRTRGWARLDPNGDEISTEDEADLERLRTDDPLPRNWRQNHATTWVAERGSHVLSFVYHNSRDATTGHRDMNNPLEGLCDSDGAPLEDVRHSRQILDELFHFGHSAYISPLPVQLPDKRTRTRVVQYPDEVQVPMDNRLAGR